MPDNHCDICGRPFQGTEAAEGCFELETCSKRGNENCVLFAWTRAKNLLTEAVEVMRTAKVHVKKRMEALRSQEQWDECSEAQTSIVELLECRQRIESFLRA